MNSGLETKEAVALTRYYARICLEGLKKTTDVSVMKAGVLSTLESEPVDTRLEHRQHHPGDALKTLSQRKHSSGGAGSLRCRTVPSNGTAIWVAILN